MEETGVRARETLRSGRRKKKVKISRFQVGGIRATDGHKRQKG